jgi:serine/threonine-protein kinase
MIRGGCIGARISHVAMTAALLTLAAGCGGSATSDGATGADSSTPTPSESSPATADHDRYDVGGAPCGIADADGSVWVSDASGAQLLRIDPDTGDSEVTTKLDDTPCEITVAYGSLWVVTQSGYVYSVDPATGEQIARVRVGATSYQVMSTPGAIWVSNRGDSTLTKVDPKTNKPVDTVPTPGVQPGGMVFASGSLWIGDDTSSSNHLLRMNLDSGELTKVRSGGARPAYLAEVDGDVWVSNYGDGTVSHIDGRSGRLVATVETGTSPVNLKPGPPGTSEVWVPDDLDNTVTRVDARSDQVIHTYQLEGGPAVVRAVGDDIWVTLFAAGALARITPNS